MHDGLENLPIPFTSGINPQITNPFFIHVVLSLGKYKTEIDALMSGGLHQCFQKTRLIGKSDNEALLEEYKGHLLQRYILKQVVHLAHSLRKVESNIAQAPQVICDIVMHSALPSCQNPISHLRIV